MAPVAKPPSWMDTVRARALERMETEADRGIGPRRFGVPRGDAWRKPALYSSLGLGVVGLGLGAGYSVAAISKNREVEAESTRVKQETSTVDVVCPGGRANPRCTKLVDLAHTRDAYMSWAIGGYVASCFAAAGALAIMLTEPDKPQKAVASVRNETMVLVAPSLSGVVVWGRF
jgi:hypothetical protein